MSMTRVICFANNKGGSGKSTTCSNVGYAMSAMGKRVLLIDGDMQMNLTLSFFDEEKALEYAKNGKNLYTAVREQKDLYDFIVPTEYENLDIIPSSTLMSGIEFELFDSMRSEYKCACSRKKTDGALIATGIDELKAMYAEGGTELKCQFCGKVYNYSKEELGELIKRGEK